MQVEPTRKPLSVWPSQSLSRPSQTSATGGSGVQNGVPATQVPDRGREIPIDGADSRLGARVREVPRDDGCFDRADRVEEVQRGVCVVGTLQDVEQLAGLVTQLRDTRLVESHQPLTDQAKDQARQTILANDGRQLSQPA